MIGLDDFDIYDADDSTITITQHVSRGGQKTISRGPESQRLYMLKITWVVYVLPTFCRTLIVQSFQCKNNLYSKHPK